MLKKLLSLLFVFVFMFSALDVNAEFVYNPIDFEDYLKDNPLVKLIDDKPYPAGYNENIGGNAGENGAGEAFKVLSALGIANSYGKSGTITRAEFTETAMRAIGLGDIPKDGRNLFLDVDADASYSKYINAAYDLNIVSGSDGLFNPDTPITYADAVVIAVKILGRNDEAKSLGAYPYGYEKSARRHGLFSGVEILAEYDDYADTENLYKILKNTVECDDFAQANGFSDKGLVYKNEKGTNILGFYHDIYLYNGVVGAVGVSSIYNGDMGSMDTVRIGDMDFKGAYDDYIGYLGMSADVYYKDTSAKNEILYINCDDYNNTALINAEDIISFYNLTYEYNENGKTKTKKMSSDASFIYNGRLIADNGTALYTPENGYLVLIDNNQNGAYDIAVINARADLVVGDVDIENKTIYDAYKMGESVCFDRDDDVSVGLKDSAGKNLYFGMVKKGNILTVFKSADNAVIKGIISNDEKNGIINSVKNESNDTIIEINGTEYVVSKECARRCKTLLAVGKSVKIKLNIYGEAADIESFDSSESKSITAYVIDFSAETEAPGSKKTLKLIDQNGEIKKLTVKERCTVDGSVCKTANEQDSAITLGLNTGKVIFYKTDESGEIDKIDTAYLNTGKEDDVSTLRKIYGSGDPALRFKSESYGGGFGEEFFWKKTESTVFIINKSESEDKRKYRVASMYYPYVNDKYYAPEAYRINDSFYADVLVSELSSSENDVGDKTLWVVEDIRFVSSDAEDMVCLYVNSGSAKKKILVYEDIFAARAIDCGDIIRCDLYNDEVIGGGIVKTYDCSEDKITEDVSPNPIAQYFLRKSFVYDKKDDILMLCSTDKTSEIPNASANSFKAAKLKSEIYSINRDNKGKVSVKSVSQADILTYCSSGDNCTKILGYWKYMILQKVFILNY